MLAAGRNREHRRGISVLPQAACSEPNCGAARNYLARQRSKIRVVSSLEWFRSTLEQFISSLERMISSLEECLSRVELFCFKSRNDTRPYNASADFGSDHGRPPARDGGGVKAARIQHLALPGRMGRVSGLVERREN